MSEERIEFKMLDAKLIGSDTVVFRLEDNTQVKVSVQLDRAGVATNYKNPDGTPYYTLNFSLKQSIIPSSKKFSIPKSQIMKPQQKEPKLKPI